MSNHVGNHIVGFLMTRLNKIILYPHARIQFGDLHVFVYFQVFVAGMVVRLTLMMSLLR